jgi:peptidoglycan/xylan/chitin deacetylase (PgdA/CDA1 family)
LGREAKKESRGNLRIYRAEACSPAQLKSPLSSDLLVLCYHAVSERWPADLSITPANFAAQLGLLADRGYRGVTFSEAVATPAEGKRVAVTFDDAYRSVLELGEPILTRLGWPATVYVPTDFAGTERPMSWPGIDQWVGGEFDRELVPLSWEELDGLAARGWEIGSHTCSHPRLTQLDDAALEHELIRSKQECEDHLGRACASIAYPYGDHDERVVEVARRAGYYTAGTLPSRMDARDPLRWPRVGIYYGDDLRRFKTKVSPLVRGLRASRAWEAADRLRTRLRGA